MKIPRPQPLGAFPMPAGLLLIVGDGSEPVREALLAGKLPSEWPASLEGARLAYAGELDAATEWFAARQDDPASLYNLWVLDPERVPREGVAHALGDDWQGLVDYVAFASGLTAITPPAERADGEIAALLAVAQAAADVEADRLENAAGRLRWAADQAHGKHPALEAVILAEFAGRAHDLDAADEAVRMLSGMDLRPALAEALYQQASLLHEAALDGRRPIGQAIAAYTQALREVDEIDDPSLAGRIHLNLGTAYLAQPISGQGDALRAGIAVQSLRHAVTLLDEKRDPEALTMAQLNLANALVYAPSAGQRDNMMEAVDLYQVVIDARRGDPAGRARALANQGNALAHLGLRDDAANCYREAKRLFNATRDANSVALVEQMEAQLATTNEEA